MSEQSRSHRVALIAFVVVASAACLALGWWQWQRYDSAAGSAQNLGYALQWPLFAGFFVYAYFRFVRLEKEREAEGDAVDGDPEQPREIPEGLLPPRPTAAPSSTDVDPTLREYNKLLAELADGSDAQPKRTSPERNNQ
ncbi:transcriptional regulator [Hoyosella rhizosphaerae]|uniref:transcriptional regulator n=1 Tax=Hoyosella rhizosphaerae TaxID=1755582 RepID=UPI0016656B50|nr:transcriptional regulator [Hoyosella rhizosphaerae]MBN4925851.1 transcriptional regulator [Hoyosella rhizosphaerae]